MHGGHLTLSQLFYIVTELWSLCSNISFVLLVRCPLDVCVFSVEKARRCEA